MSESLSSTSPTTASGRKLGRYAILEDLARGGMAQVYVAQKDGSAEICVLKQLLVELEGHATAVKRFHREAHVASYLNHPNIARVTDAGVEDNTFCIAFEYIAGKDIESLMHELLPQGRMLPYEVSVAVALGVLEGLAYAHRAKDPQGGDLRLVHRDLSPRNMMLSFDGEVKIIDFGLARGNVDDFRTQPGMVLGTLRYISPEQALTQPVDARSDLYSVSAVLHELLTGRWLVQPGKPVEVLNQVVREIAPQVTDLNPHLPKALGPVIAKGLEKEPEDRWQSAEEYRRALRQAAGRLAETPKELLGRFVREIFPEDAKKAAQLISQAHSRYGRLAGGGEHLKRESEALFEPTRVGEALERTTISSDTLVESVVPTDLRTPLDLVGATRTGLLDPTPSDLFRPTELMADPSGVTRTLVDPTEAHTAVRQPEDRAAERTELIKDRLLREPLPQEEGRVVLRKPQGRQASIAAPPPSESDTRASRGLWLLVTGLSFGIALILVLILAAPDRGPRVEALEMAEPEPERPAAVAAKTRPKPVRREPEPAKAPPTLETEPKEEPSPAPHPAPSTKQAQRAARLKAKPPTKTIPQRSPQETTRSNAGVDKELERMIDELERESGSRPTRSKFEPVKKAMEEAARRDVPPEHLTRVTGMIAAAYRNLDISRLRNALTQYRRYRRSN